MFLALGYFLLSSEAMPGLIEEGRNFQLFMPARVNQYCIISQIVKTCSFGAFEKKKKKSVFPSMHPCVPLSPVFK